MTFRTQLFLGWVTLRVGHNKTEQLLIHLLHQSSPHVCRFQNILNDPTKLDFRKRPSDSGSALPPLCSSWFQNWKEFWGRRPPRWEQGGHAEEVAEARIIGTGD